MEYIHQYIIHNGQPVNAFLSEKKGDILIYEVIRMIDQVPMFLEQHLNRLMQSARHLQKEIPYAPSSLKENILELAALNNIREGNLKISLEYNEKEELPLQMQIGFIAHKYPGSEVYQQGVKTITSRNIRVNPAAKVQNDTLRNELNNLMQSERAYEAILVHPGGFITEGSRSNIFFIKNNEIYTAPDHIVLSGVTRGNIIAVCKELNIPVIFEPVKYTDLPMFEAAFISGTSPKVLPVRSIDQLTFQVPHPISSNLAVHYDEMISRYIQLFKTSNP